MNVNTFTHSPFNSLGGYADIKNDGISNGRIIPGGDPVKSPDSKKRQTTAKAWDAKPLT